MSQTFNEFAIARLNGLLRYATALTSDPDLAQDIVQEVLIRAPRNWHRISAVEYPNSYLRRMVFNEYMSWCRRQTNREVAVAHPVLIDRATVDDHAVMLAERDAMRVRIASLPRRQRAAIVLRYYAHLTDAQIAEEMGCLPSTVRRHISHALAKLRAQSAVQEIAANEHAGDSDEPVRVMRLPDMGLNHAV